MVCSWCDSYSAQAALESSQLQIHIECPPVTNTGSGNGSSHRHNDFETHGATETQTIERPLFWSLSCCLLQRVNRSLMRSFREARSEILKQRPYHHYCNLHNLTSRRCRLVVASDTTRESTKTVSHLNRYHHQFPLDLQGWPRRWTQTVLFHHVSVVI